MIRAAKPHRRPAREDNGRDEILRLQYDGQRAGPEALRQRVRLYGHILTTELHRRLIRHHEGQGLDRRSPLHLVDFRDGFLVKAVSGKPVDGFGRHSDKTAASDNRGGFPDVFRNSFCLHLSLRLRLQERGLIGGNKAVDQLVQVSVHDRL